MAANSDPIYSRSPNVDWIIMTAANTTIDLTAGTIYLVWTADATNGGFLQSVRLRMIPVVAGGTSVATCARLWVNNGSTTATAANNSIIDEITLPATTSSLTAASANYEIPVNKAFDLTFRIYMTLGTAPTQNGWAATGFGGNY